MRASPYTSTSHFARCQCAPCPIHLLRLFLVASCARIAFCSLPVVRAQALHIYIAFCSLLVVRTRALHRVPRPRHLHRFLLVASCAHLSPTYLHQYRARPALDIYYLHHLLLVANCAHPSPIHLHQHRARLALYIYYLHCILLVASWAHPSPIYLHRARPSLYIYIAFCLLPAATCN